MSNVERIFMDVWTRCKPLKLSVYASATPSAQGSTHQPLRNCSQFAMLPPNIFAWRRQ
jgi:NADPH-dependent 7-cyano-7-deazaguanine reductase QueF